MKARSVITTIAAFAAVPLAVSGQASQAHSGGLADHQPHLFAAADFGIDPGSVTFTKDIAPILQRSCEQCHWAGGGDP